MSYNIIAITDNEPNWQELHAKVFDPNGPIEMFPIDERDGIHYLGLSIPSTKLDKYPNTWAELEKTIKALRSKYSFKVFDLYGGFYIDDGNLMEVKKQLIGNKKKIC